MFSSVNKCLLAAAKFLVAATKILFVVPNFVAVTKRFFPCTYNTHYPRFHLHTSFSSAELSIKLLPRMI